MGEISFFVVHFARLYNSIFMHEILLLVTKLTLSRAIYNMR